MADLCNRQHSLAVQMQPRPAQAATGKYRPQSIADLRNRQHVFNGCTDAYHARLRLHGVNTDHRAWQTCATDSIRWLHRCLPHPAQAAQSKYTEHGRSVQQTTRAGCTDAQHARLRQNRVSTDHRAWQTCATDNTRWLYRYAHHAKLRQHWVSTQSMADLRNRQHVKKVILVTF